MQSEVSVGTIYHYFGNKEGIAGALYVDSLGGDQHPARARFLLRRRETELADAARGEIDGLNRLTFETIEAWYRPHAIAGELRDLPLPLLYAVWFGPAQEYARAVLEQGGIRALPTLQGAEPALSDAAWTALRSSR